MLEEKGDKTIGHFPNTEKRLKRKIKNKAKQLKTKTKDRFPGIIVIYDDRLPFGYLIPDDIRFAMYGNDIVEIAVPNSPNLEPVITAIKFGGGRRTNADTGTYISVIAHLKEIRPGELNWIYSIIFLLIIHFPMICLGNLLIDNLTSMILIRGIKKNWKPVNQSQ